MTGECAGGDTTVAIVDDHQLLVETVTLALTSSGVAAIAVRPRAADDLLEALLLRAPDLVLLDLDLGPFGDAVPIIRPLVDAGIRVLLVTGVADRLRIAVALEQGAIGFQPKSAGFEALLQAAQSALTTAGPLHPAETAALQAELAAHRRKTTAALGPFAALTEREQQTLRELADGRTVPEIARGWVVAETTVRSHVQQVLRKLGANSQLQAVAVARRSGWLDRDIQIQGRAS
jgi:DNA-binding NarL/FixJ family response regulator